MFASGMSPLIVPHSLVPATLSFAYRARPSLKEWDELSAMRVNPSMIAPSMLSPRSLPASVRGGGVMQTITDTAAPRSCAVRYGR
eukprot:6200663-Pleurochrysis_carterae.AAC.4